MIYILFLGYLYLLGILNGCEHRKELWQTYKWIYEKKKKKLRIGEHEK